MTDRLKIVKIRARNVTLPRVHGHKRLDDDVSFSGVSFSLQESDGVVFSMLWGTVLLKHTKKLVLGQHAHVWQWPLSKKVAATVWPLHFDTKSEQSDCNKSFFLLSFSFGVAHAPSHASAEACLTG